MHEVSLIFPGPPGWISGAQLYRYFNYICPIPYTKFHIILMPAWLMINAFRQECQSTKWFTPFPQLPTCRNIRDSINFTVGAYISILHPIPIAKPKYCVCGLWRPVEHRREASPGNAEARLERHWSRQKPEIITKYIHFATKTYVLYIDRKVYKRASKARRNSWKQGLRSNDILQVVLRHQNITNKTEIYSDQRRFAYN